MLAVAESPRNLAKGRRAYPSSTESSTYSVAKVTDGNAASSWRTVAGTEKQWVYVDLGQRYSVSRIRLNWDSAHASEYHIQTRISANNWQTIYRTTSGDGGVDDIRLNTSGRYIRVFATKRGTTARNYGLKEFEIYP
jgi:hypothetical protein